MKPNKSSLLSKTIHFLEEENTAYTWLYSLDSHSFFPYDEEKIEKYADIFTKEDQSKIIPVEDRKIFLSAIRQISEQSVSKSKTQFHITISENGQKDANVLIDWKMYNLKELNESLPYILFFGNPSLLSDEDTKHTPHSSISNELQQNTSDILASLHRLDYLMSFFGLLRLDYYPDTRTYSLTEGNLNLQQRNLPIEFPIELTHPEDMEKVRELVRKLDNKVPEILSLRARQHLPGESEYRHVAFTLIPEYDKNGRIFMYSGLMRNITDEEEAKKDMALYIRKTNLLNTRYKISMWNYDIDRRIVYSENPTKSAVYKSYTDEEFIDMLFPADRKKFKEILEEMHDRRYDLRSFLCRLDPLHNGNYIYMKYIAECIKDFDGNVERYIFICHDITNEQQHSFRLHKLIEHIHLINESCGITLWNYNPKSNRLVNEDPLIDASREIISISELKENIHPDDRGKIAKMFAQADSRSLERTSFGMKYRQQADKGFSTFHCVISPIRDEENYIVQYAVTKIDVTDRVMGTDMLRFSQEVGQMGSFIDDLMSKKHHWSDEMFQILDIDKDSIKPSINLIIDCIHPDDLKSFLEWINADKNTLEENYNHTFRIITSRGQTKWIEEHCKIQYTHDGCPGQIFGTLTDVSRVMEMKGKIDEMQKVLNAVIKKLPALVFVKDVDDDFRILLANDAYASFAHLDSEEVTGKYESEVMPKELADYCHEGDLKAIHYSIENPLVEIQHLKDDYDNDMFLQFVRFVTHINGKNLLVSSALDVTDMQKALSKAKESDYLKSAFLANMSHEIRTPLNAIVGFSEMLADGYAEDDNEKENFIRIIRKNNDLLLQLINDILDLSKIESGMLNYTPKEFDLCELVQEQRFALVQWLKNHEKNLNVELLCNTPSILVFHDPVRIGQVTNNLLTNAAKYSEHGTVHISLSLQRDETNSIDGFLLKVKDEGIGISEENQKKLFHRFAKLDTFAQGNGLGLTICKGIVEKCKGKIGCESDGEGKGSTFWIWLPLVYI